MPPIRPADLPVAASVPGNAAIMIDTGTTVERATPAQIADTGAPNASQAEAEAGVDNAKRMSPLRVAQAIAAQTSTAFNGKANATAIGIAGTANNMGTYTGATIPDNQTAKQNIQSLETAVEAADQWIGWLREDNDIRWYGYVGDGAGHPLSGVSLFKGVFTAGYTLAQWQALVPQVTALTNQIDRIAVQAWFNDRPAGGRVNLPYGTAVFDAGIQTGRDQTVHIEGASRDLSRIKFQGTGWLWMHGWDADEAANGTFTVKNLRIMPNAGGPSDGVFRVRFSGIQLPWCHIIHDVLVEAENDFDSYFVNVTETWNIKRGADWRNFVWFGRFFFVLGSSAHLFPANAGPDCPPGQEGQDSGDSWNFDNCMGVGYHTDFEISWAGFDYAIHAHEQFRWVNTQSYSCVSAISCRDTNTSYAPADNFILHEYGWQGEGPFLDIENCEHIRCYDALLVADDTSPSGITRIASFINCRDTIFDANEMLFEGPWTGGNAIAISGANTENILIRDNMNIHYATSMTEWLFIASDVLADQVIERGNKFRGPGAYGAGKISDASGRQISETRVRDIMAGTMPANLVAGSASASVDNAGRTVYEATYRKATGDAFGNVTVDFPAGLFRGVMGAPMVSNASADDTTFPIIANAGTVSGVTCRVVSNGISPASGTNTTFRLRQIGR